MHDKKVVITAYAKVLKMHAQDAAQIPRLRLLTEEPVGMHAKNRLTALGSFKVITKVTIRIDGVIAIVAETSKQINNQN